MVNVFSGDARNGGALDPSIRGVQGPGRVPVIIDGTEQALTVWRGYNGASNRNYIDPSLISDVQVLKGPVSIRGVNGSTGGAVVINTLDADDILDPGRNFGLELRLEGGNNSTNRSEEHTSELQSLMRISYAVFCLKKKKQHKIPTYRPS